MLEVFRGSEGPPPALQRTDITSLVQALVDDRAELGAAVSMSGSAPPALVDPASLRRVLGNLLDNAQRYAGAATVTVGHEPGTVWLAVEGRGPGIPEEQLAQVLQPFVRVEGSRNPASGGTGLSLFIASQLLQRMGGELSLRNRPGGGLSVRVQLSAGLATGLGTGLGANLGDTPGSLLLPSSPGQHSPR